MKVFQLEGEYLIHLLSAILLNKDPEIPPKDLDWVKLYRLSNYHHISNMVFYGVKKLTKDYQPPEDIYVKFERDCKKAIAKDTIQLDALKQIRGQFERNEIQYLPLKGAIIKDLYPQTDMRLMSDIDILVLEKEKKAVKSSLNELHFELEHESIVHDTYHRNPLMNIEIHYTLMSKKISYYEYFLKAWDRVQQKANLQYEYEMKKEDFLIYLLAHLTKHFTGAGTGIRSIMDVWVYLSVYSQVMNWEYIQNELESIHLWEFSKNIFELCKVWFDNKKKTELLDRITEYILLSGVYGNQKNEIISNYNSMQNNNTASRSVSLRFKLWWQMIFPNLNHMRLIYPILNQLPIILPFSWLLRILRTILFRRNKALNKMKNAASISEENVNSIKNLIKEVGL